MPNNLTDAEVKKALEYRLKVDGGTRIDKELLDLINRQEEEIKEYEKVVGKLGRKDGKVVCVLKGKETEYIPMNIANVYKKLAISKARAEAYKECLEKIEQRDVSESDFYVMVKKTEFDNLLKEFERKENTTYDD